MAGFDFQMVVRFVSTLPVKGSTLSMEIYLFYNQRESESRSMENNGKPWNTMENNGKQSKTMEKGKQRKTIENKDSKCSMKIYLFYNCHFL